MGKDKYGHAIFSSFDDGVKAAYNKFKNIYDGKSKVYSVTDDLRQFSSKYATDPNYSKKLASVLGISEDTRLRDIEIKYLMKAVSQIEDSTLAPQIQSLIDQL